MNFPRRCLIVLVSIGWIAPLSLSFWAEHNFVHEVIWPWVAWDKPYAGSFHPADYAPNLFYFSMAWVAAVIGGWVWRLTRINETS